MADHVLVNMAVGGNVSLLPTTVACYLRPWIVQVLFNVFSHLQTRQMMELSHKISHKIRH